MTADWQGWGHPEQILIETKNGQEPLNVAFTDSNTAKEFISGLRGETPHLASAQEGAQAVAFTEAVYQSAKEGCMVEVP